MLESMPSVLFVCRQNVCRSIAAEAVFRYLVKNTGIKVKIDSAGTHALPGCSPDSKMSLIAALRGYDLSNFCSRTFITSDLSQFNLILTASKDNLSFIRSQMSADTRATVGLLMDYSHAFNAQEILFSNERGYDEMLDCIEDACLGLYHHLLRV